MYQTLTEQWKFYSLNIELNRELFETSQASSDQPFGCCWNPLVFGGGGSSFRGFVVASTFSGLGRFYTAHRNVYVA